MKIYSIKTLVILGSLTCLILSAPTAIADKLLFAAEITRHGQRMPSIDLPSFPSTDPAELGQLTPKGIEQLINLGKTKKEDYIKKYNLLSNSYNTKEVYARSTDLDRTLMSANAFLIGMFATENKPQPFAIHTLPIQDDELLLGYLRHYDYVSEQKAKNPKFAELSKSLEPQFLRLSTLLNMQVADLDDFISIAETLHIRKQLNQPIPSELSTEEIHELYQTARKAIALTWQNREVGALTTYTLFNQIKNHVNNAIENNKNSKFVLYSTHDVTLLGVLSAIGLPAEYNPEPASNISVLLFNNEQENNEHYVKFLFNNQELSMPDCNLKTTCTLNEFENLVEKIKTMASAHV